MHILDQNRDQRAITEHQALVRSDKSNNAVQGPTIKQVKPQRRTADFSANCTNFGTDWDRRFL